MTGVTDWGEALFLSLSNAFYAFIAAIPLVIAALLIILIGWIISNVLARIVREILERAGADRLFAEHGGPCTAPARARSSRASSRPRS